MQTEIIKLENGQNILVEVLDIKLPDNITNKLLSNPTISDMPEGAEPIGVLDDIQTSLTLLENNLKNISNSIIESFKENQPSEFSIEINFGFAGKSAIPFIASAQTDAGIKVKATWKKEN